MQFKLGARLLSSLVTDLRVTIAAWSSFRVARQCFEKESPQLSPSPLLN